MTSIKAEELMKPKMKMKSESSVSIGRVYDH